MNVTLGNVTLGLVVAAAVIALPAASAAQFVNLTTVISVLHASSARDEGDYVTLRGFVVAQLGRQRFLFRDGTGEMRVRILPRDFPGEPITPETFVELHGKVEKEFFSPVELYVRRVRILPEP